ncbi:hypothetical protein CKAH01_07022 [Colletotrichum kahawae]|uniref:Uncharacterized protein n=1 Tax=Colletotrichum kahawae TaxID=34407 RepID=A0AAD9Y728_COLKA|nr:hypothetical protein CKAH01_07022 [Colletotrichum kahawae]
MTISSEPPVIRHARPKQPEEHEGAISKQPLMSREMGMVYRFVGITTWILRTCYWLHGLYIERDDWRPLRHLCLAATASLIVAIHFRDIPITTKIRLGLHATLLYFFFTVVGGQLSLASVVCTLTGNPGTSIITQMAIVYCWSILTAIIWGFLVAIGSQDKSDIRLPYWFKEFLLYGLAKHIKERDSSKERSYIDKKEQ